MKKRGISDVVTVVLLVAFILISAGILFGVIFSIVRGSAEETSGALVCLTEVELGVSGACYDDGANIIKFNVRNKKGLDYGGDFFAVQIFVNGEATIHPTRQEVLGSFVGKDFIVDHMNPSLIDEIFLIPRVKRGDYCLGKKVKFDLVECNEGG